MSCTKATAGPGLGLQAPQIEAVPVASATRSGPGAGCHWQCPLAVTVTVTRDRDGPVDSESQAGRPPDDHAPVLSPTPIGWVLFRVYPKVLAPQNRAISG